MRRHFLLLCVLFSFALILAAQEKTEEQAEKTAKSPTNPQEILKLDPNNETAHLQLADAYFRQKRLEPALEHARSVIRIVTNKPQPENMSKAVWAKHVKDYRGAAYSIAGQVLMQQDKAQLAISDLKIASELLADNQQALAPVLYNLAFAYAKMRYFTVARTTVIRAEKIPGPYQELSRRLEYQINQALIPRK